MSGININRVSENQILIQANANNLRGVAEALKEAADRGVATRTTSTGDELLIVRRD